jgi:molybdopterin/thiamine biosynthesis adenylyltransferase
VSKEGKKVVVVGAGGNIGSHLVAHLARAEEITGLTLIDRDVYTESNLRSQDIIARDLGESKAEVQARRVREINPRLAVTFFADPVESVPLGALRGDVILSCLDSRIARQYVNQFAWRLGVPVIDAGVLAMGWLARVNVYDPVSKSACLECAWDERDYELLEFTFPCAGGQPDIPATGAPSSLGALAASLQALECQKLLSERTGQSSVGVQVLIEAAHRRHFLTRFDLNPGCRFDHDIWRIDSFDCRLEKTTLREIFILLGDSSPACLRLEGKLFVKKLTCPRCGLKKPLFHLECSLDASLRRCSACGQRMMATGFDLTESLKAEDLSGEEIDRSLRSLGLRSGDIFTVCGAGREAHYEIIDDRK